MLMPLHALREDWYGIMKVDFPGSNADIVEQASADCWNLQLFGWA